MKLSPRALDCSPGLWREVGFHSHERRGNKSHFRHSINQPMPLLLPSSALHSDLPALGRAAPTPKPSLPMTGVCWALMGASLGLLPDLNPPGDAPRWSSLRFRTIYVNGSLFPAVCFTSYSNICRQISRGLKSGCCLLVLCCFEAKLLCVESLCGSVISKHDPHGDLFSGLATK